MSGLTLTAFTGKDNRSLDMGRILWALAQLALIGMQGFAICVKGQAFDPTTFAAAEAMLLFGGGAGLRVKADTEPDPRETREEREAREAAEQGTPK